MQGKIVRRLGIAVLSLVIVGAIYATDVLLPKDNSPQKVVLARKLLMQAQAANAGDLQAKLGAGSIAAMAVNARSIASLATFIPTVFNETYSEVYPIQGSMYYFKGAPLEAVQKAAQSLNTAAEELAALAQADNRAGVERQLPRVLGNCGGCHGAYRGER